MEGSPESRSEPPISKGLIPPGIWTNLASQSKRGADPTMPLEWRDPPQIGVWSSLHPQWVPLTEQMAQPHQLMATSPQGREYPHRVNRNPFTESGRKSSRER